MAQAIVDPSEVRKFSSELRRFNEELEKNLSQINAKLGFLGQTWRDQEHKKFQDEFNQTINILRPLMNKINQYNQFLGRKAGAAEKYLQQR